MREVIGGRPDVKRIIAMAKDAIAVRSSRSSESSDADRVDPRVLLPRLLLRAYAAPQNQIQHFDWQAEIGRLVSSLPRREPTLAYELDDLCTRVLADADAESFHRNGHYLGSPRRGLHLGLALGATPVVACITLSELDIETIAAGLPDGVSPAEVLVLSRLCSRPTSQRNILSFSLARARNWLSDQAPGIRHLVTYCDPNLGFSGSVYRAAGWSLLFRETKAAYYYLDGEFATHRRVCGEFGSHEWSAASRAAGARLTRSSVDLMPLEVWTCEVQRRRAAHRG